MTQRTTCQESLLDIEMATAAHTCKLYDLYTTLRSRTIKYRLFQYQVTTMGKLFTHTHTHTHMCLHRRAV